jgi:hypothetical protein
MEERQHPHWRETLRNWRNEYWTGAALDEHSTYINMVQVIARAIIPSIYYRDPQINPHHKRPGFEEKGELTAELLNYYMREQKFKRQVLGGRVRLRL